MINRKNEESVNTGGCEDIITVYDVFKLRLEMENARCSSPDG